MIGRHCITCLYIGSGAEDRNNGAYLTAWVIMGPNSCSFRRFCTRCCYPGYGAASNPCFPRSPRPSCCCASASRFQFSACLRSKVHVEANWAVMGYISAGVLAVNELWPKFETWNKPERRLIKWAVAVSVIPSFVLVLHARAGFCPLRSRNASQKRTVLSGRRWGGINCGLHVKEISNPTMYSALTVINSARRSNSTFRPT